MCKNDNPYQPPSAQIPHSRTLTQPFALFASACFAFLYYRAIFSGTNWSLRYWEYGFPFQWHRHPLGDPMRSVTFPKMLAADLTIAAICTVCTWLVVRKATRNLKQKYCWAFLLAFVTIIIAAVWASLAPIGVLILLYFILFIGHVSCIVVAFTAGVSLIKSRTHRDSL